jgi:ATP-dependent DNA helicase RecG
MIKTYDLVPAFGLKITDLSIDAFKLCYLPLAVDGETLAQNGRSDTEQLASLRFFDLRENCPTNGGILLFGLNPLFYLPGAYIQYVKFSGEDMISNIVFEKQFSGAYVFALKALADFIIFNIVKERPVRGNGFQEHVIRNYPNWSLRELVMNAVMHRNYESNAPIYIYEFSNRIEIINPGGLYGDVTLQISLMPAITEILCLPNP